MAQRRRSQRTFSPIGPSEVLAFGAPWCAPWVLLGPALEAMLCEGFPLRLVDVDEDAALAEAHRVISLPTFVVMRGSSERRRITGAVSAKELRALFPRKR